MRLRVDESWSRRSPRASGIAHPKVRGNGLDPSRQSRAIGLFDGQVGDPSQQHGRRDQTLDEQDRDELPVFLAKCGQLARGQVMALDAVSDASASADGIRDGNGPVLPAARQGGRLDRHTVDVEPMELVERRQLPECAVYGVDGFGPVLGLHIDLDRRAQAGRCVRMLSEDRLRPEDEELLAVGDPAGGTNGVLELVVSHFFASRNSRSPSLSSGVRTAKKGELCRSLTARELVDTRKVRRRSGEYALS